MHDVPMGEGEIHVSQEGDDWVLTVEGIRGTIIRYATRAEAVEAGRRVATAARSKLRIDSPGTTSDTPLVTASSLRAGSDAWPGPVDEEQPLFST